MSSLRLRGEAALLVETKVQGEVNELCEEETTSEAGLGLIVVDILRKEMHHIQAEATSKAAITHIKRHTAATTRLQRHLPAIPRQLSLEGIHQCHTLRILQHKAATPSPLPDTTTPNQAKSRAAIIKDAEDTTPTTQTTFTKFRSHSQTSRPHKTLGKCTTTTITMILHILHNKTDIKLKYKA